MKKTILTLFALTSMTGASFAQLSNSDQAFTLIYKNATGTQNCLANSAPNNGGIATNGGGFVDASGSTYDLSNGIVMTTGAGTANGFNMFDFPLTTSVCSSYRAESTTGLDFSDITQAQVQLTIHADADNTPLQFWMGHSGGSYYPANSTYNIGNGSSFIKDFTVGTGTTTILIDYTGEDPTTWALWSGNSDIDMWGLTYTGATDGINVTVEKVLFGTAVVTSTTSANSVNDQVSLYPNPAKGSFNVDMSAMNNSEAASVKVMNSNGAVVKSFTTNNAVEMVSTDGMNKGIYMVQITAGNKVATKKVVVD